MHRATGCKLPSLFGWKRHHQGDAGRLPRRRPVRSRPAGCMKSKKAGVHDRIPAFFFVPQTTCMPPITAFTKRQTMSQTEHFLLEPTPSGPIKSISCLKFHPRLFRPCDAFLVPSWIHREASRRVGAGAGHEGETQNLMSWVRGNWFPSGDTGEVLRVSTLQCL